MNNNYDCSDRGNDMNRRNMNMRYVNNNMNYERCDNNSMQCGINETMGRKMNMVGNMKELRNIIDQSSFAIDDIKLFLDTHPCDEEALKCYEDYKKIRNVAMMEYTHECGPISAYDVNVDNKWTWVNRPWPWEGEC